MSDSVQPYRQQPTRLLHPQDSPGKNIEVVCHSLLQGTTCLSELSTMTHLSWVALQGMAHSFIELDKAVVHAISLVSFL